MMGTLAASLVTRHIELSEETYHITVEGDVENVDGVLKITQIRVRHHLLVPRSRIAEAREAFSTYIASCPSAQTVLGCIAIKDELVLKRRSARANI